MSPYSDNDPQAKRSAYCTLKVTTLLSTPSKLACTVMDKPAELAERVPVPLPLVRVRLVVSETLHITELVMSCGVPLLGKTAFAVNVTVPLCRGVVVEGVKLIEVGVPSVTVTVVVAPLTVPEAALMVVVHTPVTVLTGLTSPFELIVAQDVGLELQLTFPVRSFVEPSL